MSARLAATSWLSSSPPTFQEHLWCFAGDYFPLQSRHASCVTVLPLSVVIGVIPLANIDYSQRSEKLPLSFRVLTSVKVVDALIDRWFFNNSCGAVYDMLSSLLLFSHCCAPLIQRLNEKLLVTHPDHPCLETEVHAQRC